MLCMGPRGDPGGDVHSGQSTPERSEAALQHLSSGSGIAPWSSETELNSGARNCMDILETCVYNTRRNMSMSVLTTELQQSNAANDNDVHKRGNGIAGHFQVL